MGASVAQAQDADGDGVADGIDQFPCSAAASGVAFAPAANDHFLLIFEDLWPRQGDLDFNDVVLGAHYVFRTQGAQVSSIRVQLDVLALGSLYDNGLGLHLPVPRSAVASVTRTVNRGQPQTLEPQGDAELTVVVSDNTRELFGNRSGPINSTGAALASQSVELEIVLVSPLNLSVGAAPFDLFIFRSGARSHEIHRPEYRGTAQMNGALFGTEDDGSAETRAFVDYRGLPFVLVLPQSSAYPLEDQSITALYPDLLNFAASAGATHRDFYQSRVQSQFAYAARPNAVVPPLQVDRACVVGQTPTGAGLSCAEILQRVPAAADGLYWIDPDGANYGAAAFQVWCDMSTDGGGWEVIHFDDVAHARQARGTPGPTPGWSLDFSSAQAALRNQRVESFRFELGEQSRVFDGMTRYGSSSRLTIADLFLGTHQQSWRCNSDAPNGECWFTTADGRHWGLWDAPTSCCLGGSGFWFYSRSTAGTENWGVCSGGYPLGSNYSGAATACDGAGYYTPVTPSGSQVFRLSVRLYVPPRAEGATCRTILEEGRSRGDGVYVIDPDGPGGADALSVWCDMTTDGGGWIVVHDDVYAQARRPRGTPSAQTGWSIDYWSSNSPLSRLELEDFHFELPGIQSRTFRGLTRFGSQRGPTPAELFSGAHNQTWSCNSDAPSSSACWFSTSDGRHWGLWESTSACCIGSATGGYWFYSSSASGTENWGLCGDGYPRGAGYAPGVSGCSGASHYTPVTPTGNQRYQIRIREASQGSPLNGVAAARASCREILDRGESRGNGYYWLLQGGEPYRAFCEMTLDGGGWTAFFVGRNGSPNVFDHFDEGAYDGFCPDPGRRCLRRLPSELNDPELAVVHGDAAVALVPTEAVRNYFTHGVQADWQPVQARALLGSQVLRLPNYVWTGSGTNRGWLFAQGQSGGGTFAAAYDGSTSWNYGNGSADTSTRIMLLYRQGGRPADVVRNTSARASCRQILDAGESAGSGLYWLSQGGAPYQAWCDMQTDGGGWTTFFAGQNGSINTFDHLENGYFAGVCTDPARRCMRRVPTSVPQAGTEVAVVHGRAAVALEMTAPLYQWATAGVQSGWINLPGTALPGDTVNVVANSFWTGSGSNNSWIAARGQSSATVFAAAYNENATWDSGNGRADTWTPIRLMYREGGPIQDPRAGRSCRALLQEGRSTGDGVYLLQQPGGRPYSAYCDMTTDGGGWTAVFSGRNGSPNVFDYFDSGAHSGVCNDPATRCLRRSPNLTAGQAEVGLACGGAMVRLPLNQGLANWLNLGSQQGWIGVPGAVSIGAQAVPNLPNYWWTGSGTNYSFVVAREQAQGVNTFASSYNPNTSWNYCNGAVNTTATLRVFYRELP